MEELITLLIPAVLAIFVFRLLFLPLKWAAKLAVHSLGGFACLWLLNTVSAFTGILFPINAVTVLVAGVLGLPGIAVLALLAVL